MTACAAQRSSNRSARESAEGGVERVAEAGVAEEGLDEEAREGGVRRGGGDGGTEELAEGVVARVEAEEGGDRVERVGELAGGGEGAREEGEVGRRGPCRRWGERKEESEGRERVGVAGAEYDGGELVVAEVGEKTGELRLDGPRLVGVGVGVGCREVGRDEVDDGDARVEGARQERRQGVRRNARHCLGHGETHRRVVRVGLQSASADKPHLHLRFLLLTLAAAAPPREFEREEAKEGETREMMRLQIPARSGVLRRLLHLGGAGGVVRPYSTGDRRRRVIREAQQEEEDEAFLRTLNFNADPENNPPPPPRQSGGDAPDSSSPDAAFPTDILRRAAGKQQEQREERPEGISQKAIGESLMEKLKLGDAGNAASATGGNGGDERSQPEREPTNLPPPPEQEPAQPQDMDEIFRKMKETGLIPNAVAMLDGLCKNGLVQDAMKLFGLMREKGSIPEVVVYTAVVEAFCKGGKLDDAVRIFRKMQGNGVIPNAFSYWLLIQGLCKGGRLDDAVDLCVEMFEAGHSPNAMTFVGLVDAVCKAKGSEAGEKLVRSFQDRNFAIDEKSIREHLNKKGPFSPVIWEVIFGKKKSGRPF
uniref:Pentacotripeptide-repeat region of PRORP domain-containing protein n=1 Tax=Leersia perrieri TaxID=77586 RepID=A0A0D9V1U7_9ORYZ